MEIVGLAIVCLLVGLIGLGTIIIIIFSFVYYSVYLMALRPDLFIS